MKKLTALLLALIMVFSLAMVASAAVAEDASPVVPKTYQVINGEAPATTFNYSFTPVSYKDGDDHLYTYNSDTAKFEYVEEVPDGENITHEATIPAIENVSISFDAISASASKTVNAVVDADDYELGVYTYEVCEIIPETQVAGITYSTEKLYLVLTVIRHEDNGKHYFAAMHYESADGTDKEKGFTNVYDSGSLTVTKKITGNLADMNKKFTFTVVFTPENGDAFADNQIVADTENRAYDVTKNADGSWTYVFELGHNDTATFTNIPANATYTVTEDNENYTLASEEYSDSTKKIASGDTDTAVFTNDLTKVVDTGIALDSMPFVLMLAVAVIGMGAIVVGKKRYEV